MKLVVGLGNPGKEYVGTRHNIGFEVVEQFASRLGWIGPGQFQTLAKKKFNALAFDGTVELQAGGTEKVLLLEPLTYMNLSGRTVQARITERTPQGVYTVTGVGAPPFG